MTRAQAIRHMRSAGYHNDSVALSILHASRKDITKKAAEQAFRDGRKGREAGVRCGCNICAPKASVLLPKK